MSEEQENTIEKWWFNERLQGIDLYDHMCIDKLKVCCPAGKYGPECNECPGYPNNICNNNGNCKGNGTRKGSGKCNCKKGYTGDMCDKCASGYYEISSTDGVSKCDQCDKSCSGHCRDKGPKGCEVCKEGYSWDQEYGCLDIDECLELGYNPCKTNTFCVNTEGSYQCFRKLINSLHFSLNHIPNHLQNQWPFLTYKNCCMIYCKSNPRT